MSKEQISVPVKTTIEFLTAVLQAADIKTSRGTSALRCALSDMTRQARTLTRSLFGARSRSRFRRFAAMFSPLKITFRLDGTGVYYDPFEPPMLDGILAAACARHHVHGEPPARDEEPDDIPLPLKRWDRGGTWGWHASALFPDGDTLESLTFWRKRLRQNRIEITQGSPNLTNGVYRDWNMPLPLLLARTMVAYAFGDRDRVRREIKRSVRWIGKKRAHGRGRVVGIEVERIASDGSITLDGAAMRWMPAADGPRLVRPRPPYWSNCGRVHRCEIGA